MKGFAMLKIGQTGWIEKEAPVCGPMDAICKPLALAPCTSDVHTVWAGAIGDRKDMILGHEAVGEIVEVGKLVKDFIRLSRHSGVLAAWVIKVSTSYRLARFRLPRSSP